MNKEKLILKIRERYGKVGFFRRLFSWPYIIEGISDLITNEPVDDSTSELSKELEELRKLNEEISFKRDNLLKEKGILEEQLNSTNLQMLNYTKEIHKIFNSSSGKQGKISELRLEDILISVLGVDSPLWTKNLPVKNGRVEFAMKTDNSKQKWVPIDSKSLVPVIVDGEFVLDSNYINKVRSAAKEISAKYLTTDNTESFGLMILPSESIFNQLYEEHRNLFTELNGINISILSPYTFLQFLGTVKSLGERFETLSKTEGIVKSLTTLTNHIVNFHNSAKDGLESLNKAFDSHLPKITKKTKEITVALPGSKEIKEK